MIYLAIAAPGLLEHAAPTSNELLLLRTPPWAFSTIRQGALILCGIRFRKKGQPIRRCGASSARQARGVAQHLSAQSALVRQPVSSFRRRGNTHCDVFPFQLQLQSRHRRAGPRAGLELGWVCASRRQTPGETESAGPETHSTMHPRSGNVGIVGSADGALISLAACR